MTHFFSVKEDDMTQAYSIESAIHRQLAQIDSCSLDEESNLTLVKVS